MASKPFNNEELVRCAEHIPGHSYLLEAQANTSAPYGDKFDVLFRTSFRAAAEGAGDVSLLHVEFTIQWSPSMSYLMKSMMSKAIEGDGVVCGRMCLPWQCRASDEQHAVQGYYVLIANRAGGIVR
jgi:hypothetical protein